MPAVDRGLAIASPRLFGQRNFRVQGQVAIVDPTGSVVNELRTAVDPATITARRAEDARRALAGGAGGRSPDGRERSAQARRRRHRDCARSGFPISPWWRGRRTPMSSGERMADAGGAGRGAASRARGRPSGRRRAGERQSPTAPTTFTCRRNLDDRIENQVQQSVREAIVDARARAENLDRGTDRCVDSRRPSAVGDGDQRRRAANGRRLQPGAAVRLRRADGVRDHDRRAVADDVDDRGEVEPRRRGPVVRGVSAGADGRKDPRPDGRQPASSWACTWRIGIAALLSFALVGLLDPGCCSTWSCSSSSPTW